MVPRQLRLGTLLALAASVAVLTGCPVPASYTTTNSAPVSGRLSWDDGTPARDIPIVLATEWARTPCGKVALQTTTDSTGAFALEGTSEHHSVMWIVPNLDIAAPSFDLCANVGDTLRHMYRGIGSLRASAEPASLACTILRWEGSAHASCNDRVRQTVVSGGHWSDSTRTARQGLYRILLTEQPTHVSGYKKGFLVDRPYVYLQWLEPIGATDGSSQRFRIDSTVSLPIDRDKVGGLYQVQLWRREGQWLASFEGYEKSFATDFARAELSFALGAPGEAASVAGPLELLLPGARLRFTSADGRRVEARLVAFGDSALELRAPRSDSTYQVSYTALRAYRNVEVHTLPAWSSRVGTASVIGGALLGGIAGAIIHNSRKPSSAAVHRRGLLDDIAGEATVGGLVGWEIGIHTLGGPRWRPMTMP